MCVRTRLSFVLSLRLPATTGATRRTNLAVHIFTTKITVLIFPIHLAKWSISALFSPFEVFQVKISDEQLV